MKLKILLATGMVLMAGCNPTENAAGPQPAANTVSEAAPPAVPKQPDPSTQAKHAAPLGTEEYPSVQRGSTLSATGSAGNMAPLLISGWSGMEPWGVWSDGEQARIGFKIDGVIDTDVEVTLLLKAFMAGSKNELTVIPTANGKQLAPLVLRGSQISPVPHVIRIAREDVTNAKGRVQLDFEIQDPRSPQDFGLSADPRKLGIGLVEISVQ